MNKVFTLCITVSGSYWGSFVFEDNEEQSKWMLEELPKLRKKYNGDIKLRRSYLPGLKVGDKCNVWGEGDQVFTIRNVVKINDYRYSFLLDSGCTEEVARCHTEFLKETVDGM